MNPNQMISNLISKYKNVNNPIVKNAIDLYQSGNTKGLQEMAQNICKNKGFDINEISNQIMSQFK